MDVTPAEIDEAARRIRAGGLVAFPTETVYGLGANALDPQAVARIFEAKQRPFFDPLIVHVPDLNAARALVQDFSPQATRLASRFWPGPLTLVLPKLDIVPDIVTAGMPTVAIRVPEHPVAQALLKAAACPIAAPSANPFGRISPTTAAHVREQLGDRVDLILDGGPCRVGVESTVLSLVDRPVLLRHGGVPVEDLEAIVGPIETAITSSTDDAPQAAPGMLTQHYAPRTPLRIVTNWHTVPADEDVGALFLVGHLRAKEFVAAEVLSQAGDLPEAAASLFAAMRRLDAQGLRVIYAELAPEVGIGRAINDRLRRAAAT
ncbi:MAG: threonylcarbamoyl-AMP synthase [Planctomycetaceae bacterium]|nr:threonylcarbamoyl-AMP synthase [Planctomycetaceae bacterium]